MKRFSASASLTPGKTWPMNSFTPSVFVDPGNTVFTVTPVPRVISARLREIESCIVFVALWWAISGAGVIADSLEMNTMRPYFLSSYRACVEGNGGSTRLC
jgi:hypothetical protein